MYYICGYTLKRINIYISITTPKNKRYERPNTAYHGKRESHASKVC